MRKIDLNKRRDGVEKIERVSEATVKISEIEKAVSDKVSKRTNRQYSEQRSKSAHDSAGVLTADLE